MRLNRHNSLLLIVDVQSRLAPAVAQHERVTARSAALIRAARLLGVPVVATEHCAERIGPLVPALRGLLSDAEVVGKRHFCCTDEPEVRARLDAAGRRQIVVTGMEAHVCAMQAALGLAECGYTPFFVQDATGSRHPEDHAAAVGRLRAEQVGIVTAEMVLFEWTASADAAAFRDILAIVKSL